MEGEQQRDPAPLAALARLRADPGLGSGGAARYLRISTFVMRSPCTTFPATSMPRTTRAKIV